MIKMFMVGMVNEGMIIYHIAQYQPQAYPHRHQIQWPYDRLFILKCLIHRVWLLHAKTIYVVQKDLDIVVTGTLKNTHSQMSSTFFNHTLLFPCMQMQMQNVFYFFQIKWKSKHMDINRIEENQNQKTKIQFGIEEFVHFVAVAVFYIWNENYCHSVCAGKPLNNSNFLAIFEEVLSFSVLNFGLK